MTVRYPWPPRWMLVVLALLAAGTALSYADTPLWILAAALLGQALAVGLSLVSPVATLVACATGTVGIAVALGVQFPAWAGTAGVTFAVLSGLSGHRIERAGPALVVFGYGAALSLALGLVVRDIWSTGFVLLGLCVLLPWLLGRSLRQQAALGAAAVQEARLRERTRIAHDMHDTLGHELGLLTLRAGALELASDVDDEHRAALAELRASAGAATERLAEIVGMLRGDEPAPLRPEEHDIEELVRGAADAGMAVRLDWTSPRTLPAETHLAAHRVVREALTNAAKHAPGAAVRVCLTGDAESTVVTVTNEVHGGRGAGGGVGLVALAERVRLAGGTLRSGISDGVFEVVAELPGTP